jgi:hypothetical protein
MNRFLKRLLLLTVVLAALIFCFLRVLIYIYALLPNDYSRIEVLLSTLKDPEKKPAVVVFGDSRSVFGIDAKTISANMPGHPLAFNMASVGQATQEGAHYFSMLPSSVKHVIQCMPYEEFMIKDISLSDDKTLAMRMYGYTIDKQTEKIVDTVNPYFYKNKNYISYQARVVIKSAIHNYVRNVLDDEKFSDNFHDIYFPNVFTTERHPHYPFNNPMLNNDSLHAAADMCALIGRLNTYCKSRGIKYHYVLMPLNPDVEVSIPAAHDRYIKEIKEKLPDLDLIDLSGALDNSEFYDGIHPNKKGAEKLSAIIARNIH